MNANKILYYARNCFWLFIPALLLDIWFRSSLPTGFQPEVFWANIPTFIAIPENTIRILVFTLAALMPFTIKTSQQKVGLVLYAVGMAAYIASWAALIAAPQSTWSTSAAGFLAPAYTPFIWISGIGLIGDRLFVRQIPYKSWIYIALTAVFLGFHIAHADLIYLRLY